MSSYLTTALYSTSLENDLSKCVHSTFLTNCKEHFFFVNAKMFIIQVAMG